CNGRRPSKRPQLLITRNQIHLKKCASDLTKKNGYFYSCFDLDDCYDSEHQYVAAQFLLHRFVVFGGVVVFHYHGHDLLASAEPHCQILWVARSVWSSFAQDYQVPFQF
ncbi:unnamed protein product, partial [Heterosigma akashiwo]